MSSTASQSGEPMATSGSEPRRPLPPTTELAKSEPKKPETVKDYLALPSYRDRFNEIMGKRAPQFMASIINASAQYTLRDCEPKSVIAAACVAATLDLPIDKNLGFAHIVPYKTGGVKIAQFQMGYKGIIQLALRSGQYQRLNAGPVNKEVFVGYDEVGEPRLDWTKFDAIKATAEPAGYFAAWRLVNGFTKSVYWPKDVVESHAQRYSQAYRADKKDSPWFTDFPGMATKTVLMNGLRKWGILSVEMQKAIEHDQGIQQDVDAPVKFIDGQLIPEGGDPDLTDILGGSERESGGDKPSGGTVGNATSKTPDKPVMTAAYSSDGPDAQDFGRFVDVMGQFSKESRSALKKLLIAYASKTPEQRAAAMTAAASGKFDFKLAVIDQGAGAAA